ncbi:unnamed protein product (macronuclear) [Paramecium tetraurelia]|uniref:Uncharacterized protein n=1 Tax=Paramecium tetraurelia TaxID=5888 RepID=A0BPK1_PARTE|nr:uncharacterized protein GSPATT00005217001 [Paramecium tetraurelia]CAK60468.1 unnamed protein product [Paramecium tetraurelia]|eukprot:XP_001427866.1 hypothetical protein (macronuclear) [Paramecium tetraurelia strain d4-2]
MINDLQLIAESQHLYDFYPTNNSCPVGELMEADSPNKRHYISSLCFQLKKKIKRNQNRPSVLKIEDSGRNVKIYQNTPSQNNLERMEDNYQ